ncbi:MAG TPA: VWA domain-containing protein, partial [Roseiarcus sp.]|nr:VWA domain-containing protein [Roseiarcus sp.]
MKEAARERDETGAGMLAANIVHFGRALREAGVPLGPGTILDALAAVEAAGFGDREDFYTTLHAVFVKKHDHSLLFDQAFQIFWKRKGLLEKLIAMLSPQAPRARKPQRAEAGASRIADALFKSAADERNAIPSLDLDARFTMSDKEILRSKDFAQMSAAEIAEARKHIKALVMPEDRRRTRRFTPSATR